MKREKCQCGREITLPKGVFGRTDEILKIKGVKFWPSQVGTILRGFPEFENRYRIFVKTKKGVDFLELIVEGHEGAETRVGELSKKLKQETLLAFNKVTVVNKLDEGSMVVDEREGRTF